MHIGVVAFGVKCGGAAAAAHGYVAGFAVILASIPLVGLRFASAMVE